MKGQVGRVPQNLEWGTLMQIIHQTLPPVDLTPRSQTKPSGFAYESSRIPARTTPLLTSQQRFVDRACACAGACAREVAAEAPLADDGATDGWSTDATGSVTTQCAKTHIGAGSLPTSRHGVRLAATSSSSVELRASHGDSQPRTRRSACRQRTSALQRSDPESIRPPATYTVPFSTAQPKKLRPTRNLLRRIQRICIALLRFA